MNMNNRELTFEYRDEFKRKEIAGKIARLLTDDEFSPMVLDGDWGVGKTEFCHKLVNLIKSEQNKEYEEIINIPKCQCLYIDAFAEDHGDDPLLMLLGNIAHFIKNNDGNNDTAVRYQRLRNACIAVAKSCFKIGGKAAIGWLLRQRGDEIEEELLEAMKKSTEEGLSALVDVSFQQYEEAKSNLEKLKVILEEIASENERLIVIVDELDRCRPNFSVDLLEKIKHVFNVCNVSFLLVANMRQLEASISHVYGDGIDVSRYVDKFIKLIVTLPMCFDRDTFVVRVYLYELMKRGKMPGIFKGISLTFVTYLLESNSHSLRDVEHFARYAKVLERYLLNKWQYSEYEVEQVLAVISIYLCCFSRDVVRKINIDNINVDLIFNSLNFPACSNKGKMWYNICHIIESLDTTINQETGVGNRGFVVDKEYIFDETHAHSFKSIQRIFIDYIMNLSLVRA